MPAVFTICSNNYLAQAKTLGDSLKSFHPSYEFSIFLVDRRSREIDYSFFNPHEIITIEEIGLSDFEEMFFKYNITELNTAVKPFIFDFLFKRNNDIEKVIYLDPDILVFQELKEIDDLLNSHNVVLTPHFFTPIYDTCRLSEPDILNAGIYNLGFLAVKRSDETQRFLDWWMIKLKTQCFVDFKNGLFVDQLWINFVPLYFQDVFILRHLGYNVAYWNLHERALSLSEGNAYVVNGHYPLVFFHYSGYNFLKTTEISKYQNRFSFAERKDLIPLFEKYQTIVWQNKYEQFSKEPCYFLDLKRKIQEERKIRQLKELNLSSKIKRALQRRVQKLFGINITLVKR